MGLEVATTVLTFALAGLLDLLIGLGGSAIVIPILTILGLFLKQAIANGMVTLIATSSGPALAYVRGLMRMVKHVVKEDDKSRRLEGAGKVSNIKNLALQHLRCIYDKSLYFELTFH
jgi:hypothetical protein